MNGLHCAGCAHAFSEAWAEDKEALRCGWEGNGRWSGRVVDLYPAGKPGVIANRQAPAWCRLAEQDRRKGA